MEVDEITSLTTVRENSMNYEMRVGNAHTRTFFS